MTDTNENLTIQQIAEIAHQQQKVDEEIQEQAAKARQAEEARPIFVEMFGVEPDAVDGSACYRDGLRILCWEGADYGRKYSQFSLALKCADCGEDYGSPFYDLASLHRLLQETPSHPYCLNRPSVKASTAAERLANAILDVIQEQTP